jgi:hypothetical protein
MSQNNVPLSEKLDQIMAWIDLPLQDRPQFISGIFAGSLTWKLLILFVAYEPSLDQAGHATGPNSQLVNVCRVPTVLNVVF